MVILVNKLILLNLVILVFLVIFRNLLILVIFRNLVILVILVILMDLVEVGALGSEVRKKVAKFSPNFVKFFGNHQIW